LIILQKLGLHIPFFFIFKLEFIPEIAKTNGRKLGDKPQRKPTNTEVTSLYKEPTLRQLQVPGDGSFHPRAKEW